MSNNEDDDVLTRRLSEALHAEAGRHSPQAQSWSRLAARIDAPSSATVHADLRTLSSTDQPATPATPAADDPEPKPYHDAMASPRRGAVARWRISLIAAAAVALLTITTSAVITSARGAGDHVASLGAPPVGSNEAVSVPTAASGGLFVPTASERGADGATASGTASEARPTAEAQPPGPTGSVVMSVVDGRPPAGKVGGAPTLESERYGTSTKSVATMDSDGTITVSNGSPDLVLDVYEDAICPICADLDHQYGEQMAKAVDDGQLTLRYKVVDFLNASSHSGDYSTRAYAAMMAVAKIGGDQPGVFMSFHTALYDARNQPQEDGPSDLSNAELAKLAEVVGASDAT